MELGNLSKKWLVKELRKTQQELHCKEHALLTVVENIKEVVFRTDINGKWVFLNNRWEELTDHTISNSLGKLSNAHVHPEDRDLNAQFFKSLFNREIEFCRHEIRYLRKDGGFLWMEVFARLSYNHENEMVGTIGTLLDITERKQIDEFEKELLSLTPKLIGVPSEKVDHEINMAMEQIGRFLHTDRAYIFEFSPDGFFMNNTYEWCNEGISPEIDHLKDIPTEIFPEWMKHLRNNEVIQIANVSDLPDSWMEEKKILEEQEIKSLVVIPMMTENELLGYVGLDSVSAYRTYRQTEINILRTWSSILSGLIIHKRSEVTLNQERKNLNTFFNTVDDFLWVLDMQGNIIFTNETVNERLGYTPDELQNLSVLTVHPEKRREEAFKTVMEMLNGTSQYCSVPLVTKRDEEIPVETRIKLSSWDGKPCMIGVSKDISKIKLSEEKFSKAFHLSSILMSISDYSTGNYMEVNQAFIKLLEFSTEEVIGKNPIELGIFKDYNTRNRLLLQLELERSLKEIELEVRSKSGKRLIGLFTAEKVIINNQLCLLTSMVDITDRKDAEEELQKARLEAEKANNAKSEFLSRMSHELRTPMNSVLGFAQILQMGTLNPKQQKGVSQILQSGNYLLELINEVLDLSRIESGKMNIHQDAFYMTDLLMETIDLVMPLARKHGIQIHVDPVSEQSIIHCDQQRLKQVLLNLLSNAIKYNKQDGEVFIESIIRTDAPSSSLSLTIRDTGMGIKPELLDKLFQPFERLSQASSTIEGTGLGMAVVKSILEAMGGSIQVLSVPEMGTNITIEIPINLSKFTTENCIQSTKPTTTTNHLAKILLVEDNMVSIELIKEILQSNNLPIELIVSINGGTVLDLAKQHHPNLIVLDLGLPDMSGVDVLKSIKSDPDLNALPVIILSADATPYRMEKLLHEGAAKYLTKPIEVQRFLSTINKYLLQTYE